MEFLFLLLLGIPGIFILRWMLIRGRFTRLEERVVQLEREVSVLKETQARMIRLPAAVAAVAALEPEPEAAPAVAPVSIPIPAPVAAAYCEWCGKQLPFLSAVCLCRTAAQHEPAAAAVVTDSSPTWANPVAASSEVEPQPIFVPVPEREPVAAGPSFSERLREKMGGEEWEALVGGSLLNKLGALVLVIGIALGLIYSFTQLGPAPRAAMGLAVSLAMLISGIFVERREKYRVFARGLLGGGWAALYFTTYAMHAVAATKVIDSPVIGTLLLIAVAAGMIVHSLRYRSQTVTGLSYFIAFVTLAIAPVTTLSVVALIPLAASLLYVAYRFSWTEMALFGLVATWGTLISRGDSGAPAWQAQTLFTIYWLLFEIFDLLRTARRSASACESAIMPLNALAFAGLSYAKWSSAAPQQIHLVAAAIGVAYLASAILRVRLRPPSSFVSENTFERFLAGGYEGPITISVILSSAAVLWRFDGYLATLGLLAQAECLFLAGLYFNERYLRQLAAALFGVQFAKMALRDFPPKETWVWPLAVSGVLFYLNRYLQRSALLYGYAGTAAFAILIGLRTPEQHLGLAWMSYSAALFAFGWWLRLEDFRFQSYGVVALGLGGNAVSRATPSLSISAAILYAGVGAALKSAVDRMGDMERLWVRTVGSWSVTVLLAGIAWKLVPEQYLGLAWMLIALPLLELGLRDLPRNFRVQSYVLGLLGAALVLFENIIPIRNDGPLALRMIPAYAALAGFVFAARLYIAREAEEWLNAFSSAATVFLCAALWALLPAAASGPAWAAVALMLVEIGLALRLRGIETQGHAVAALAFGRLWVANFTTTGSIGLLSHRLVTVGPVAAAFYHLWTRLGERKYARYYLHAASILVFALLRFELGRTFTVTGWAAMAVVALYLGQRWKVVDLRWQSYVIAGAAFIRAIATSFNAPESFTGVWGRLGTAAIVIACLYAAQLIANTERHARLYFSMLATALTTILLYHEVSGSMLTVSWGIEGILLLIAGFPLRDRVLRLSGLTLFLVCILKLFLYDLRTLDTGYRILSFIVLGLMLLSVSWIYTRFRDRIVRFL